MTAMAKMLGRSHLNIANRIIFPIQYSFRVNYDSERRLHIFPRGVMSHCSKALRRPLLIGNLNPCNVLYRLHAKHKSTSSCQVHCFSISRQLGLSGLLSCENVPTLRRKRMLLSTGQKSKPGSKQPQLPIQLCRWKKQFLRRFSYFYDATWCHFL